MLISSGAFADANSDFKEAMDYIHSPLSTDYDYKKIFEIAERLNQQGDCRGEELKGYSYLRGLNVYLNKDINRARDIYFKSAEAGCAETMAFVGLDYKERSSLGLPVDYNKAIYWLSKSYQLFVNNNKLWRACLAAQSIADIYYIQKKTSDSLSWYQKMQNSGTRKCANDEALAKIKSLEVTQQKQAEIMREDPPVAGIKLSLSGVKKSPAKLNKKSKKIN